MNNELKNIWNSFITNVANNKNIKDLYVKLDSGVASYQEAQELSSFLSNYLVSWLAKEYPSDSGKILDALKDTNICKNFFAKIDDYTCSVQKAINESLNIGLNAVKPTLKTKLINSDDVIATNNYDFDLNKFINAVELSANKRIDTIQQANAKFQDDAGFGVTVSRKYDGKGLSDGRTCKWCLERVGSNIPYKQAVSRGMFQRHEGCHCMIEYNNNGTKTRQYSKGGRKSWEDKEELEDFENKIIQKKNEIRPHVKDVTKDYFKESLPGVGSIQAEDAYYKKNNHDVEIENSRWILEKFGGNIRLITEPEVRRMADYEWDGTYWELKSPEGSGKRTISNQFNSALEQIKLNPGGMILETKDLQLDLSKEKLVKECADEMIKKRFPGDVIIKNKSKLITILHNDYND